MWLDDILVPVYPEEGDMVNVRGDDDNDVWFTHVLSVDLSVRFISTLRILPPLASINKKV